MSMSNRTDIVRLMLSCLLATSFATSYIAEPIDRKQVVSRHNPSRNSTATKTTPLQVGNGAFAYGADITGMQTFQPFGILSEWGWKNDSLPPNTSISDYQGYNISTHGKEVPYDTWDPAHAAISSWLYANPARINLGRIGLNLNDSGAITESDLTDSTQTLDLWTGVLKSSFSIVGVKDSSVRVHTFADPTTDTVAFNITSPLISEGLKSLGVYLDFPYNSEAQTQTPYVGDWSATNAVNHVTVLKPLTSNSFVIVHLIGNTTYYVSVWCSLACYAIQYDPETSHRYDVTLTDTTPSTDTLMLSVRFSLVAEDVVPSADLVLNRSIAGWEQYWTAGGFVEFSGSRDTRWIELERRVILSQYHLAVNEAGNYPPQESGLVNLNGWYGKFHMEMFFWHMAHWSLWDRQDILSKSTSIYSSFYESSKAKAEKQGTIGARWPKMTDPSGHPSPEIINSVLVWQQPHPMIFAEYEYRTNASMDVLLKWEGVIQVTCDWMSSWAYYNSTSGYYDLGPPMLPVSENTNLTITRNTAFDLAYFRLGFLLASQWMIRLGKPVPSAWSTVMKGLAPLPIWNDTYVIYEGIGNMWNNSQYVTQHPSMAGMFGWLPPTTGIDIDIFNRTVERIYRDWDWTTCWGWDFPLLAMTAARLGDTEMAVDMLLHPDFDFDDIGMPLVSPNIGSLTPYFPSSGSLLYSIAFMAAGWDGSPSGKEAPGFGHNWRVHFENLRPAL